MICLFFFLDCKANLFILDCKANLLSPDLLEVKNADLVNLAAAVGALNERLDLQDVVLRRLELRLGNVPEHKYVNRHRALGETYVCG